MSPKSGQNPADDNDKTKPEDLFDLFEMFLTEFDTAQEQLKIALEICSSDPFQKIYREKKYPFLFDSHRPISSKDIPTEGIAAFTVQELIELQIILQDALENKNLDQWNNHKEDFYRFALAFRCKQIESICIKTYNQSVWTLSKIVQSRRPPKLRLEAFLILVELDPLFLTAPYAKRLIREAEIAQNFDFKAGLSRAINPKRKTTKFERQRLRYALHILSGMGYKYRRTEDWTDFFKAYEKHLTTKPDRKNYENFASYSSVDALKKAFKAYDVDRVKQKTGPKPKSRNK